MEKTSLVCFNRVVNVELSAVLVKVGYLNLGGGAKDCVATLMINEAGRARACFRGGRAMKRSLGTGGRCRVGGSP
jgi:cysteine synthase